MKTLLTVIALLFVFTGCQGKDDSKVDGPTQKVVEKKVADETIVLDMNDGSASKEHKRIVVEKKVTDEIVLHEINGKKIKVKKIDNGFVFDGYEGKVVLVSFFTTWCPPCKAEIPHLNKLQEKYKNDLKIIGVLLEKNRSNEDVINFINDNDVEYSITNSSDNSRLAREVGGVRTIPFMLIYDKSGRYSQHYKGAVPQEMIEADIKRVL